jgi:hypothetical protein
MPSRKQRRRREKLQRHEYEYVIENEDGEEIAVDQLPETTRATGRDRASGSGSGRRGREVPKPSLQRTIKRAGIFGPILVIVVFVLGGNELTTAQKLFQAIMLLAVFLPFSYLLDTLMYRAYQRKQARGPGAPSKR